MGLWNCSDSVALFVFLMVFDTVPTVPYKNKYCHTVGTVPKSNRKIKKNNNAKLSEQFQSPIVKQIMAHCQNSSKVR
jgi:hypothetical protein